MSITGNKPSGHFHTFDPSGRKVEGETRQCVHCQRMWIYKADDKYLIKISGGADVKKERGWCMICHGLVCAEADCYPNPCPNSNFGKEQNGRN
jgi:hypothetical protein